MIMKKVLYFAMLVLAMGLLCSCNKDDKEDNGGGEEVTYNGVPITGKWRMYRCEKYDTATKQWVDATESVVGTYIMIFEKGKTGKMYNDTHTYETPFTYDIDGDKLITKHNSGEDVLAGTKYFHQLSSTALVLGVFPLEKAERSNSFRELFKKE